MGVSSVKFYHATSLEGLFYFFSQRAKRDAGIRCGIAFKYFGESIVT